MTDVIVPNVNINGTHSTDLVRQQIGVMEAAEAMLRALAHASPHGRDFQGTKRGTYDKAHNAHLARVRAVATIRDEASALAEAIQKQGTRR